MVKSEKQRLHLEKLNSKQKGKNSPNWKGGRIRNNGYVLIYCPEHPRAKLKVEGYVGEHILVMESHLGRYLFPNEIIHHINEVKEDNRIKNLELTTRQEHSRHHLTKKPISKRKEVRKKISNKAKGYNRKRDKKGKFMGKSKSFS